MYSHMRLVRLSDGKRFRLVISPLPPQFNQTSIPQQAQSQVGQTGMPPHLVIYQQQQFQAHPFSIWVHRHSSHDTQCCCAVFSLAASH